MIFADVPAGESVFIDANVFVYDFGPDPVFGLPCRALLERVEQGDLKGYISAHVLHEAAHGLMTVEACQTFVGRTQVSVAVFVAIRARYSNFTVTATHWMRLSAAE